MTTFTFETVDGSGAGQSCLALDKEGNPHIAYATHLQPATLPNVMYAHRNAGTWALERLPTGAIVEQSDENRVCLAIDSQGNPQVAYIDDSSNHLIWAVKRGDSWTFTHVPTRFLIDPQNVDAISFQLELGGSDPAAQDTPHFAFHDAGQQALGHTTIVDGKLQATVVEQIGIGVHAECFDTGLHPSLAWDPHASPMLAYFNINDTGDLMALRNATLLNGTWQIALLVPGGRKMGASVPVAFGIRAVAYFDVLNSALKVWADGEDRIVAPGILNGRLLPSAAVNVFQQPRVAYEDESKLKLASRDKFGEWTVQIVDPAGGFMPSLAYDNLGNAHIAYTAGNTLKYAKGTEGPA